jgi:glutamyl-tRNA synthetase/glutamyl-Q tRNA(Asp) synthetase
MTAPIRLGVAVAELRRAPFITRFAPSPTGYLHLGHVANAIFVWGLARAAGGRVHLRLEDHDRVRCKPAYADACLEDLAWLGFAPDAGLSPLWRQSERGGRYTEALAGLVAAGRVYACGCSRRDIGGERYSGRCRQRGLPLDAGHGLRVRLDDGTESAGDLGFGMLAQCPADQCGDVLVRDRDGHWTYHFAVAVDDIDQHITHVIRGADLLESTGRQVALMRLLGRPQPPAYLHHPLIYGPSGEKLSKSAADTGVREFRRQGMTPDDVIGLAASAVGLVEAGTRLAASAVRRVFGD